jgi:hypothetical protein
VTKQRRKTDLKSIPFDAAFFFAGSQGERNTVCRHDDNASVLKIAPSLSGYRLSGVETREGPVKDERHSCHTQGHGQRCHGGGAVRGAAANGIPAGQPSVPAPFPDGNGIPCGGRGVRRQPDA